jgi:hypothetical protein
VLTNVAVSGVAVWGVPGLGLGSNNSVSFFRVIVKVRFLNGISSLLTGDFEPGGVGNRFVGHFDRFKL